MSGKKPNKAKRGVKPIKVYCCDINHELLYHMTMEELSDKLRISRSTIKSASLRGALVSGRFYFKKNIDDDTTASTEEPASGE